MRHVEGNLYTLLCGNVSRYEHFNIKYKCHTHLAFVTHVVDVTPVMGVPPHSYYTARAVPLPIAPLNRAFRTRNKRQRPATSHRQSGPRVTLAPGNTPRSCTFVASIRGGTSILTKACFFNESVKGG